MKKSNLVTLLLLLCHFAWGQEFISRQVIPIPDSLTVSVFETADFDNDGVYDFMLILNDPSNQHHVAFIKGDTLQTPTIGSMTECDSVIAYTVYDYNNDQQQDVVFSFQGDDDLFVLLNDSALAFHLESINLPAADYITFGDIDNDLRDELIVSSNVDRSTSIYSRADNESWRLVTDSLEMASTDFEIFDFDRNGKNDFFVSGVDDSGAPKSKLFICNDSTFSLRTSFESAGTASLVDIDTDGLFELYFVGDGLTHQEYIIIVGDTVRIIDTLPGIKSVFWADFSNEGTPDENMYARHTDDTVNIFNYEDAITSSLNASQLVSQHFADIDHDGSLDVVQLLSYGDNFAIEWFENTHPLNEAPTPPAFAHAVEVFGQTFFYWDPASDDHTPVSAITYDLYVASESDTASASFDPTTGYRLLASHGNNGTTNFKLIDRGFVELSYQVQVVDNALFGSAASTCEGNGFSCLNREDQTIVVCSRETVTLSATHESALWFSLSSSSFLGSGSTLTYVASEDDVVFFFVPSQDSCSLLTTFSLEVDKSVRQTLTDSVYMCNNEIGIFESQHDANDISWTSEVYGDLGATSQIEYQATMRDSLSVVFTNDLGCFIQQVFQVHISIPYVTVTPESAAAMQGQSVQLLATGGSTYVWSPSTYLNQHNIPDPISTPENDIQYTVTATDSIGCIATTVASIKVETTGFVPTLFSPNADGQNDRLVIFGLSYTDDFELRIYNRDGQLVYRADNVTDAMFAGWDGYRQGRQQPDGIYYWKVDGSHTSGNRVLLNGKTEGSVVLIR
ncbi:MAG TPA: gliding motility-associated C-terminal domain-containing protein [Chryseosolibacter sp.]|nr:gliding motility-associated C-terminal domain-containing protein [Chryseosolibacter sp.]